MDEASYTKLNALHLKGLRKISGMKATYIDSRHSNKEVYKRASRRAEMEEGSEIGKLEDFLRGRARALLGHVIRAGREEPMHRAVFRNEELDIIMIGSRIIGRPRRMWVEEVVNNYWNERMEEEGIADVEFEWTEAEHREAMGQAARHYNL